MMTRPRIAAIPILMLLAPLPAAAQTTGLDALHSQTRVGGKICMTEHEHYGEGSTSSKRGAQLAAARMWSSFTTWEYGPPWGSYKAAAGKRMDCSSEGGKWTCKTYARPCRRGR